MRSSISLGNQIREIQTAIAERKNNPKWMRASHRGGSVAAYQIACLEAAIVSLEWLAENKHLLNKMRRAEKL